MFNFNRTIAPLCERARYTLWVWICMTGVLPCHAQDQPDWRHDFGRSIEWSKLYKEHGLYFAYGQNELTLFDLQTREVIWSQVFVGATSKYVEVEDDFPIVSIAGLNSTKTLSNGKKPGNSNRFVLVSLFTGDIILDTDTYDIDEIADSYLYYDAKCLLIKGKHNGARVLALGRLGEVGLQWRVPEPARLKKMTLRSKFEFRPVLGNDHLVFVYADTLFGMDIKNGHVLWKEGAGTGMFAAAAGKPVVDFIVSKPAFEDPQHDAFYMVEKLGPDYSLKKYAMADKKGPIDGQVDLGTSYGIKSSGKDLFVRTRHTFNYLDPVTGMLKWNKSPDFAEEVHRVYPQEEGYLVWLNKKDAAGTTVGEAVQWVNPDVSIRWQASCPIHGAELTLLRKIGDHLLYATDLEAGIINFSNGEALVRLPLTPPSVITIDEVRRDLLVLEKNDLVRLSSTTAKAERVVTKIAFSGDDEAPSRVRIVEGGYSISSDRNLWLVSYDGEVHYKKYIKEPGISDKAKKTGLVLAATVAGAVFKDKLADLNIDAYNSGLLSMDNAMSNYTMMAVYGNAGSGAVAAGQMQRFLNGRTLKRKMTGAGVFDHLWLVSDKLSKNKFGLRVIDVNKGEQVHELWLDDEKNFTYHLLDTEQGLLIRDRNSICFYRL